MALKQLTTYFGLAYLISWLIWLPLYGHIFGLTDLPTIPFHHGMGGLGPLMASFLTTWIYSKQTGVRQLLDKCLRLKPLIYLAIALLSPFVLAIIAMVINTAIHPTPLSFSQLFLSKEFPDFNFLLFFVYNLFFFGFGHFFSTGQDIHLWRLPELPDGYSAF